jgi:hypothetical protein
VGEIGSANAQRIVSLIDCHLFVELNETAIGKVVAAVAQQRAPLFNYATQWFIDRPKPSNAHNLLPWREQVCVI